MVRIIAIVLALSGCVATTSSDAGCDAYGRQRVDMPRPLGASPLAAWASVTDRTMTATCRG